MTDVLPSCKSATRCVIPPSHVVSTEVLRQLEPSPTKQIRIHTLLMRIIYRVWVACSNHELLALINQRLNGWPCVQWSNGQWLARELNAKELWVACSYQPETEWLAACAVMRLLLNTKELWVACSFQPETEWLAVCAVMRLLLNCHLLLSTRDWMAGCVCSDQIASNCPVVLNAKEPWVACSYQPETEWLAACAVIKWPGCGWCWTQKKRVGWSFITSILLSPNLISACPTQILHRMFYSRTAFKCLSLWTILILIQATEHMADPKLMSALFCQSAVNYPNLVNLNLLMQVSSLYIV